MLQRFSSVSFLFKPPFADNAFTFKYVPCFNKFPKFWKISSIFTSSSREFQVFAPSILNLFSPYVVFVCPINN